MVPPMSVPEESDGVIVISVNWTVFDAVGRVGKLLEKLLRFVVDC
jgi:hypothetical protein